jgi:endonuclease III
LAAFDGIGQKKAAMAVELLERHLGVPVTMMEGSDIAYDVHVRRVFMRTGLSDRDDPNELIAVARALNPARPGALDDPAWRIGAQWCHQRDPECSACVIHEVCPKLIERGTAIFGV